MKKKLILTISIILLSVTIVLLCFVLFKNENNHKDSTRTDWVTKLKEGEVPAYIDISLISNDIANLNLKPDMYIDFYLVGIKDTLKALDDPFLENVKILALTDKDGHDTTDYHKIKYINFGLPSKIYTNSSVRFVLQGAIYDDVSLVIKASSDDGEVILNEELATYLKAFIEKINSNS